MQYPLAAHLPVGLPSLYFSIRSFACAKSFVSTSAQFLPGKKSSTLIVSEEKGSRIRSCSSLYLMQTYFRDVACCRSEQIYGRGGVELIDTIKNGVVKIHLRFVTEPCQHRVSNACLKQRIEAHQKVIVIKLVKITAINRIPKVIQIIRIVIFTDIVYGRPDRRRLTVLAFK